MKKTPEEKKLLKEQKKNRRRERNKKALPVIGAVIVILALVFATYKIVNFTLDINTNIEYENEGSPVAQNAVPVAPRAVISSNFE